MRCCRPCEPFTGNILRGNKCPLCVVLDQTCTSTRNSPQASTARTSPQTDQRVAFNTELMPGALKLYASVLLEPVRIYRGKDSQFRRSIRTVQDRTGPLCRSLFQT